MLEVIQWRLPRSMSGELPMAEDPTFAELIRRVAGGDQEAATRLVRDYEKAVRRVARIRLVDSRMTHVLDSMDICQSVMASFLKRMARTGGKYEVATPAQLINLLATMARNKVTDQVRRRHTAGRDRTREKAGLAEGIEVPDRQPSPSEKFVAKELFDEAWQALTEEERRIWKLREQGKEWAAIAGELGGAAEALRKQFERACKRVKQQLEQRETGDA
jgi:RNA polymerase sigma factor (sigma-70 family)